MSLNEETVLDYGHSPYLFICPFNNLNFIKCLNQLPTFYWSVEIVIDKINSCQATGIKKQQSLFSFQGLVYIFISFKKLWYNEEGIIKVVDNSRLLFVENYMFISTRFLYMVDWNRGSFLIALPKNLYHIYK